MFPVPDAWATEDARGDGEPTPVAVLIAGYGDGDSYWQQGAFIRLTVDSAGYL